MKIGGDLNARSGNRESWYVGKGEEENRRSKDKKCDAEGVQLIAATEEGWCILNGVMAGDREGEFTYISERGLSAIDYTIVNWESIGKIKDFKVEGRMESDHMPIVCELRQGYKKRDLEIKSEFREKIVWNEESKTKYQLVTMNVSF